MSITVYHSTNPRMLFSEIIPAASDLVQVAVVETSDLDDAYRLTNHIDCDWRTNSEVKTFRLGNVRSTSCGDVMELNNEFFMVAEVGFTKITLTKECVS